MHLEVKTIRQWTGHHARLKLDRWNAQEDPTVFTTKSGSSIGDVEKKIISLWANMLTHLTSQLTPVRYPILVIVFVLSAFGRLNAQTIHAVSYNIRYDNQEDGLDKWANRSADVAEAIFKPENDIIGLQEVLYGQMNYLQGRPEAENFDSWGYGRDDGQWAGEFSPIFFNKRRFSRYIGTMKWLSETPDTPSVGWDAACKRIVTIAVLICRENGKRVTVLNTHFDHQGKVARANSVKIIVDLVKAFEAIGNVVIVLGDFNTTPRDPILRPLKETLSDACPRKWRKKSTFNAFHEKPVPKKHIDYIWFSKAEFVSSNYAIQTPKTKTGRQASDHYLVSTTLQFVEGTK